MKKYCVLIILVTSLSICFGQNTFKKVWNYFPSNPISIVPCDYGNKYLLLSGNYDALSTGIRTISTTGDYIVQHNYWWLGLGDETGKLFYINNNQFLITGYDANARIAILKIDTAGQIFWKHAFSFVSYNTWNIANCLQLPDYRIICTGSIVLSLHNYRPFVVILDSVGNFQVSKVYNNYNSDSQFIYGINSNYFLGFNSDSLGAVVAKIDTAGNVLWCKSLIRPKGFLHSIIGNSDGSITVTGNMDSLGANPFGHSSNLFMINMDSSGTIIWAKEYGDTLNTFMQSPSAIRKTSDGGYIVTAAAKNYSRNNINLLLLKTDASGNVLWAKSHGNVDTEWGQDVFQTNDGGFLVGGGTTSVDPPGGYYIIKTDSLGETTTHCQEYTDTIVVNNFVVNDSLMVLSSVPQTVNVYPSVVHDTTNSPPNAYDGCILSVVEKPTIQNTDKRIAYPNPNSGKFSISGVKKKYEITVYDNMGNVVMQKTEMSEIPPQLDLTTQPKGVYHVRIKEGDKISVSRVVVQ